MESRSNLYFIALIPQKEVADAVTEFKKDFASRFKSTKALRLMPHLTLKAPFHLAQSDHEFFLQWFDKLRINSPQFEIELKNFGSFPKTDGPVVFIRPVINKPLLSLQTEIISNFKISFPNLVDRFDLNFEPHMTIAYRDLSFENYVEAWKEYQAKEFKALFEVKRFYLLQHDTRQWNIITTYLLN